LAVGEDLLLWQDMANKFALAWNDFQVCTKGAFKELYTDQDFSDVTLVCEEDQQISAHKVILSACSQFFRRVLRNNPHSNPLIYLHGLKHADVQAIIQFIYQGQTEVEQDNIDNFMKAAKVLEIKGLNLPVEEDNKNTTKPEKNRTIKQENNEDTTQNTEASSETANLSFPCKQCEYAFTRLDNLERHKKRKHVQSLESDDLDVLPIEELNIDGIFQSNLDESEGCFTSVEGNISPEQSNVTKSNFPCDQCEFRATRPDNLKRHIIRKHTGTNKQSMCDLCHKEYSTKDNLKAHRINCSLINNSV
jgi:hypothetical protein